ncbi:hypothetical protein RB594_004925 [Gaeumannomyces avenae]
MAMPPMVSPAGASPSPRRNSRSGSPGSGQRGASPQQGVRLVEGRVREQQDERGAGDTRGSHKTLAPASADRDAGDQESRSNSRGKQSLNLLRTVSLAFLLLALGLQLVLPRDAKLQYSSILEGHSFLRAAHSPAVHVGLSEPEPVCENKPFPTHPPTSRPLTMALAEETKRIVGSFDLSDADLNTGVKEFLRQMDEGLKKDGTSLSQIPTYVTAVPKGTEKGLYMAVDLGGTNFRVCSVLLKGDNTFELTSTPVAIPKHLMTAPKAEDLFAFLAKQIELFLQEHHKDHFEKQVRRRMTRSAEEGFRNEEVYRLGFTFSFPVDQIGINKGYLIRWTKGFDIPDAVGKDVCALLQDEIDKLHLPVKVAALVNDTVGTLMARSYLSPGDKGAVLGAIFGTGTNGAYIEKLDNVKKPLKGQYDNSTGDMIINAEWGSFDNQLNVLPNTPYDQKLDKDSNNPGVQMFEKRVSGMFLGEILRLAILDMNKGGKGSLFSTATIESTAPIFKQWGVDSAIMSVAAKGDLGVLRDEIKKIGVSECTLEEAEAFKAVADAIGRRAARLSAIAVAAIVLQTDRLKDLPAGDTLDVGVDGSLILYYPGFRHMIFEAFRAIDGVGEKNADRITIEKAEDGSGVGAALIALVAERMEQA